MSEPITINHIHHRKENWLEKYWHPLCGIVYLIICFTDFCGMPFYYEWMNSKMSPEKVVEISMAFKDSNSQIAALTLLHQARTWQPITLGQNGLLHLSFGAILGVGAWSRGRQQGNQALNNLATQVQNFATNPTNSTLGTPSSTP